LTTGRHALVEAPTIVGSPVAPRDPQ